MTLIRSKFIFFTLILLVALSACEQKAPYSAGKAPEGEEAFAKYAENETRKILELSDSVTQLQQYTHSDGSQSDYRKRMRRHLQLPKGHYEIPEDYTANTPGEEVTSLAPNEMPSAIAISNEGEIVFSNAKGTVIFGKDGSTEELTDTPATLLQWDREQDALLVSGPGNKLILDWPDHSVSHNLSNLDTPGFLLFSPRDDGLWLISDMVDLSAGSKYRIFWEIWSLQRDGKDQQQLSNMPVQLSSIGSFPNLNIAWGHEAQEYRLFPDPGPIWELDDEWNAVRQITHPNEEIDIKPSATLNGELFFIRMSRIIETGHGFLAGATARAWTGNVNSADAERMISPEPTAHVTVSPNGKWLALVIIRDGQGKLLRMETELLLQQDFSPQATAQQTFENNMRAVLADLRAAFAQTEMGQTLEETQFGPEATVPPTQETASEMGTKLTEALQTHLGVEMPVDFSALGIIDDLLYFGDGYWPEEPATVMALAGLYGDVMNNLPEVHWHLPVATPALGRNLTTATLHMPDQYLTLHTPFYVARERLAGRLQLDSTARNVLEKAQPPILLTEGISADAIDLYLAMQAMQSGISLDDLNSDSIKKAISDNKDNDVVNQISYAIASRELLDPRLMAESSLNLARNNPAKADAMIKLARSLQEIHLYELALEVYDRAEALAPDSPSILYETGKGYFDELMLDEAEHRFERASEYDITGEYQKAIEETLRQLQETHSDSEAEVEAE